MCCQGVWFTEQMFHSNLLCTSSGQNEDRVVGYSQKWYQSTTLHGVTSQMTTILTIQLLQKGSYYDMWGTRNFFYYIPFYLLLQNLSATISAWSQFFRKTLQTTVENNPLSDYVCSTTFQVWNFSHYMLWRRGIMKQSKLHIQGDSKRGTQFRTSIFPKLCMICEWPT